MRVFLPEIEDMEPSNGKVSPLSTGTMEKKVDIIPNLSKDIHESAVDNNAIETNLHGKYQNNTPLKIC